MCAGLRRMCSRLWSAWRSCGDGWAKHEVVMKTEEVHP
jgi:hypothetical protein